MPSVTFRKTLLSHFGHVMPLRNIAGAMTQIIDKKIRATSLTLNIETANNPAPNEI